MTLRLFAIVVCFFAALSAHAGESADFLYGKRPPESIFDPEGYLDAKLTREISEPLAVYRRDGIEVIVVVLKSLEGAPPEHVAQEFAKAWCKSPIHCVVLHVPGEKESPWIIPAGKLVDHLVPGQVRRAVADSHRRAASEPDEGHKVKAAAREATDMLRYWFANALNRSDLILMESARQREQIEAKKFKMKMAAFMATAAIIPITVGFSLLLTFYRRRGPAYFPHQAWQPRRGAPYAGGNNAIVNLGHPIK